MYSADICIYRARWVLLLRFSALFWPNSDLVHHRLSFSFNIVPQFHLIICVWFYRVYSTYANNSLCLADENQSCLRQFFALDANGDSSSVIQTSLFNHRYRGYYVAAKKLFEMSNRSTWPLKLWTPLTNVNTGEPALFLSLPFASCGECKHVGTSGGSSTMCAGCVQTADVNLTGQIVVGVDVNAFASAFQKSASLVFPPNDPYALAFVVDITILNLLAASVPLPEFQSNFTGPKVFIQALSYTSSPFITAVAQFASSKSWMAGVYLFVFSQGEFLLQVASITGFVGLNLRLLVTSRFQSCGEGYFLAKLNDTSCSLCPIGTYSPKLMSNQTFSVRSCTLCPAGTIADQPGNSECTPCQVNQYQPSVGARHCFPCPQFSTAGLGASLCTCNAGFFRLNFTCVPCPLGADCTSSPTLRTQATLLSLPGYWRYLDPTLNVSTALQALPLFYPCPRSFASCLSSATGACATGLPHRYPCFIWFDTPVVSPTSVHRWMCCNSASWSSSRRRISMQPYFRATSP